MCFMLPRGLKISLMYLDGRTIYCQIAVTLSSLCMGDENFDFFLRQTGKKYRRRCGTKCRSKGAGKNMTGIIPRRIATDLLH